MQTMTKKKIEQLCQKIETAIYEFQLDKSLSLDTITFGEYFPNCNGYGLRISALERKEGRSYKIGITAVIQKNF